MPEPESRHRPNRSSESGDPCPGRCGKPRWQGPTESLRRFTRSPAARESVQGRTSRRRSGAEAVSRAAPFQRGREPVVAPGPRGQLPARGGPGRCLRRVHGAHGRDSLIRDASRGRPPPGGGGVSLGSPAGLLTDLHGVFQRQRTLRGASPRLANVVLFQRLGAEALSFLKRCDSIAVSTFAVSSIFRVSRC
jgi:hypothetical protein